MPLTQIQVQERLEAFTDEQMQLYGMLYTCDVESPSDRILLMENEGLKEPKQLAYLDSAEITNMANRNAKLPAAHKVSLTSTMSKKIQILVYWIQAQQDRFPDMLLRSEDLTEKTLYLWQKIMVNAQEKSKPITPDIDPGSINPAQFSIWKQKFVNMLSYIKGKNNGAPLSYVVRKSKEPSTNAEVQDLMLEEVLEKQVPLTGDHFNTDNARVYKELKARSLGTDAHETVLEVSNRDGRKAFFQVVNLFEGSLNDSVVITRAEKMIKGVVWKDEYSFPTQKVINTLKQGYRMLEEAGISTPDYMKVRELVSKYKYSQDIHIGIIVDGIETNYPQDFEKACSVLQAGINRTFGGAEELRKKRHIGAADRPTKRANMNTYAGVDISDPWRIFSSDEKNKLGKKGLQVVVRLQRDARSNRYQGRGGRGRGRGGRGRGRNGGRYYDTPSSASQGTDEGNRLRDNGAEQQQPESSRGPSNGGRFGQGRGRGGRGGQQH